MSIICSELKCDSLVEFKCDCLGSKRWCCTHYSSHIKVSNCSSICIRDYVINQLKKLQDHKNEIKKVLAESMRRGEYLISETQRMITLQIKKISNKLKNTSNFKHTGEIEDLSEINYSNSCQNFFEDFNKIIGAILGIELNHNKSYKELENEISYLKNNTKKVLKVNQASKENFENEVKKLNSNIKEYRNKIFNLEREINEINTSRLKKNEENDNKINELKNTIKEQNSKIVCLEEKNSEILKVKALEIKNFKDKENDFISKKTKLNDNIFTLQTKNEALAESIKNLNCELLNYKQMHNKLADDKKIIEKRNLELKNEIAKLRDRLNSLELSQKIEKLEHPKIIKNLKQKKSIKKPPSIVLEYSPCNKNYFLNPHIIAMSNLTDFINIYENTTNQFLNTFFNILHLFSLKKFRDIEIKIQDLHSKYAIEIAQSSFDTSKIFFVVLNIISRLIQINHYSAYQTFAIRLETLPFNIGKCLNCKKEIVLNEIDLIDEIPYFNIDILQNDISANDIGNSLFELLNSDKFIYKCVCGYISSYMQEKYGSLNKYVFITVQNENNKCNLEDITTINKQGFSLKLKSIITSNMVYLQEKLEWTLFGNQIELFSGNSISSIKLLIYEVII